MQPEVSSTITTEIPYDVAAQAIPFTAMHSRCDLGGIDGTFDVTGGRTTIVRPF